MNFKKNKFVRFGDWKSDRSSNSESNSYSGYGLYPTKVRSILNTVSDRVQQGIEMGYHRIKSLTKPSMSRPQNDQPAKVVDSKKKIFDPQGPSLQLWNKIFVACCILSVSCDPLFFYIPYMDQTNKCLSLDTKLEIAASVLRTATDIFYILHIIFQFRTGFIAPSSRVFGRGELIQDSKEIAKRYICRYFLVDILAILPLPQLVLAIVVPNVKTQASLVTKETLKWVILCQYIPRFGRIYPLYKEVTRTSGIFSERAWVGAALNLFVYMLASHVLGAFWYLFSIERKESCWREACQKYPGNCSIELLYCGKVQSIANVEYLNASCPLVELSDAGDVANFFNFGIFLDALTSGVLDRKGFTKKFFYCFWWGLRNLSSLGQNLETSTFEGEIIFSISVSIIGLVLFSFLIGNMQKYLQSTTVREEEMRVKRQDAEQWMSHRMLPTNLKKRIRRYEEYKWQETRGVEEDNLIKCLPKDLRRDIKRHLCMKLLMKVPMFDKMDEQLMDAMSERLKPVLYTEKSVIIREGDPVEEMLFIMRGSLLATTTHGGRSNFFSSVKLETGGFCGEELFTWALDPNSSSNYPISTRTVEAPVEVEAFALLADDLKFVASQFRRLHSKQLQANFKFYSEQWKLWGACFIQAAWRGYCKRKAEKALKEEEDRLQSALAKEVETSPSLGATIYASRFAANALRALRKNSGSIRLSPRIMPLLPLPQKPAEVDFQAVIHD